MKSKSKTRSLVCCCAIFLCACTQNAQLSDAARSAVPIPPIKNPEKMQSIQPAPGQSLSRLLAECQCQLEQFSNRFSNGVMMPHSPVIRP